MNAFVTSNPKEWIPIEEKQYWDALECLPPRVMGGAGFLLGEPNDHRHCKVHGTIAATYGAYIELPPEVKGGKPRYYVHDEPMTVAEYRVAMESYGLPVPRDFAVFE